MFSKKINKLGLAVLSATTIISLFQISSLFASAPKQEQENIGDNNSFKKVVINSVEYEVAIDIKTKTAQIINCLDKDIKSVRISDIDKYKIIEICDKAFSGCEKLKKVSIKGSVEIVGEEAFLDCKKLKRIELYESVKEIKKEHSKKLKIVN